MGVDPNDPFLKRVLKAKNKKTANEILDIIVDDEGEKYKVALRESLIKQFGINAGYVGKRAVNKVWEWFQPPMDFSAQPSVMQGSTVSMPVALSEGRRLQVPGGARSGKKQKKSKARRR